MSNRGAEAQEGKVETVRSADGTTIAYLRRGKGPPLVLVHGALMDRAAWSAITPFLRETCTLYAIDRRGRGDSGDTPPYEVDREVEDLAAVLEAIGKPCDLMGHSSGAILALMLAEYGFPIRRLILYEPPIILPGQRPLLSADLPGKLSALAASDDREAAVRLFLREGPLWPEEQIEALLAAEWRRKALLELAPTASYDARIVGDYLCDAHSLRALRFPVLLFAGERSPDWLRAGVDALAWALPEDKLVTLPGQDHLALQTAPEVVAREISRFLAE
jgi:pimeloyl-ACP methyl ester carboxylesterase